MAATALLLAAATAAPRSASDAPMRPEVQSGVTTEPARPVVHDTRGNSQDPVSAADVRFMSGMIPHHAQAVLMAGWAPSHGARPDLRILCERMVVAQRDEIALMQSWLRDRDQPVPAATATHMRMSMNGTEHDMLMPGMLTDAQLAELDRSRGPEFDRLFLQGMIRHHQGALSMVEELLGSYGAAQDDTIFKFASDVVADQSTEIERMEKMLAASAASGRSRQ